MDQSDVDLRGLETHTREFKFLKGFVTCTNCGSNYSAQDPNSPVFCQTFSVPIVPSANKENIEKAEQCLHFIPKGIDRNKVVTPNHKNHYEDWNI